MAELKDLEETDPRTLRLIHDTCAHEWTPRSSQQIPPGDWRIWLIHTGRGWGKNATGGQSVRARIDAGIWSVVNVVAATMDDAVNTMVHGTDIAPGLMRLWPAHQQPKLNEGKRKLVCHNGSIIRYFSAEDPDRFRGQNAMGAWADEVDSWKPKGTKPDEAWNVLELGVRLGPMPQMIATSTPKRSRLVALLRKREDCYVTTGSTWENEANLSPAFIQSLARYEGTHLARQELHGELVEEIPGALVTQVMIDAHRITRAPSRVAITRVAVGVDPSGGGDAQGIVVVGRGVDGAAYVLADRTCSLSPEGWGRRVVEAADEFDADCISVERNYGGDMCEHVIKGADPRCRVKMVTASRGKHVRFEPVAMLYEQGRIAHVGPTSELDDEVTAFTAEGYEGAESPNRADALVWAMSELFPLQRGPSLHDLFGDDSALVAQ